jgi:hypothetical protein
MLRSVHGVPRPLLNQTSMGAIPSHSYREIRRPYVHRCPLSQVGLTLRAPNRVGTLREAPTYLTEHAQCPIGFARVEHSDRQV